MAEGPSPTERAVESYKRLAVAADYLTSKSDEFSKIVAIVDAALKKLNLGVAAWERIRGSDDDGQGNYWGEYVGYARVSDKWGIALSEVRGNHRHADQEINTEWLFNDAPRSLRISAIDKIPDLFDKLIKYTDKTARKIDQKIAEAQALADALSKAAAGVDAQKKGRRS
jgi:hypothetical protein